MSRKRSRHGRPALTAVAGAQLRLLLGRCRRGVLVAVVLIAVQIVAVASAGILFGIRIEVGHDEGPKVLWSRISDFADELEFPMDEGIAALAVVTLAAALWGFFWPFHVWCGETPRKRDYHWAMPVERRRHDLLRIAVGAAALPVIVLAFLSLAVITAAVSGNAGRIFGFDAVFWVALVATPVVAYLLVSIPVVGARHPAAWLWGTLGAAAALFSLAGALPGLAPLGRLLDGLVLGEFGLLSTLGMPIVGGIAGWETGPAGRWLLALLLWLLVAVTGVFAAASRRSRSI